MDSTQKKPKKESKATENDDHMLFSGDRNVHSTPANSKQEFSECRNTAKPGCGPHPTPANALRSSACFHLKWSKSLQETLVLELSPPQWPPGATHIESRVSRLSLNVVRQRSQYMSVHGITYQKLKMFLETKSMFQNHSNDVFRMFIRLLIKIL